MPDVHSVIATVRRPSGQQGDPGQVTEGHYTLDDGLLTMADSTGAAVRRPSNGEKITHRMHPAEDARIVACRLTLEIYRILRGETAATATGFGRKINYPRSVVA
jgi:hypothetical protein